MESRTDMLARHARELAELAELDSRWWEEDFMEDPFISLSEKMGWLKETLKSSVHHDWIRHKLPTIIRKREKIGVTVARNHNLATISTEHWCFSIDIRIANKLTGRTLAPGEKVTI